MSASTDHSCKFNISMIAQQYQHAGGKATGSTMKQLSKPLDKKIGKSAKANLGEVTDQVNALKELNTINRGLVRWIQNPDAPPYFKLKEWEIADKLQEQLGAQCKKVGKEAVAAYVREAEKIVHKRADTLRILIASSPELQGKVSMELKSDLDDRIEIILRYPWREFDRIADESHEWVNELLAEHPNITITPTTVLLIIKRTKKELAKQLAPQIKDCIKRHPHMLPQIWREVADTGDSSFLFLLEKEVLPVAVSNRGTGSPRHILNEMIETGNVSVVNRYLSAASSSLSNEDIISLIHQAALLGNLKMLRLLVSEKVSREGSSSSSSIEKKIDHEMFTSTIDSSVMKYMRSKDKKSLDALKVKLGWYFLSSPMSEIEKLMETAASRYSKDPSINMSLLEIKNDLLQWGGMVARKPSSSYHQVVSESYYGKSKEKSVQNKQRQFLAKQMDFGSSSYEAVKAAKSSETPTFLDLYQKFSLWRSDKARSNGDDDWRNFHQLRVIAPPRKELSMKFFDPTSMMTPPSDSDDDFEFPTSGSDDDFDFPSSDSDDDFDFPPSDFDDDGELASITRDSKSQSCRYHPKMTMIHNERIIGSRSETPIYPRNTHRYGHFLRQAWKYREKVKNKDIDAPKDSHLTKYHEFALSYTSRSTKKTFDITLIGRLIERSAYLGWLHSPIGSHVEAGLDDMEIIHREILDMKVNVDDPKSVNALHQKIAEGFWVLANTMPTSRGNGHLSLMMMQYWYRQHGFSPAIPSIEVGQIDGMAISTPLSEFVKPEIFLSLFDKPAEPST